jgi:hypothetical protein
MLDRAAQDLLQVSFFDRGKTSGLRPAPLSHDMIALLLISAAEQVVDQLVIDLGHYMPTRVGRAGAVDVTQLSFCVRGYHARAYAFDLLQQAPSESCVKDACRKRLNSTLSRCVPRAHSGSQREHRLSASVKPRVLMLAVLPFSARNDTHDVVG